MINIFGKEVNFAYTVIGLVVALGFMFGQIRANKQDIINLGKDLHGIDKVTILVVDDVKDIKLILKELIEDSKTHKELLYKIKNRQVVREDYKDR